MNKGGLSTCVPGTHTADVDEVLGSLLWKCQAVAIASICKMKQWMEELVLFSPLPSSFPGLLLLGCHSAFQVDKKLVIFKRNLEMFISATLLIPMIYT